MASNILFAVNGRQELKGATLQVAQNLARAMDAKGVGNPSFQWLAWKSHCTRRTAITCIQRLEAGGVVACDRHSDAYGHQRNRYRFLLPIPPGFRQTPVMTRGERFSSTLSLPGERGEKTPTIALQIEELRETLQKYRRFSDNVNGLAYQATVERLAALENFQQSRSGFTLPGNAVKGS